MAYIDLNLEIFDTEDLIDELDSRGLKVIDMEDSGAMSEAASDEIYDLYRDYISGNDFDRKLKEFFEGQLGLIVL